MRQVDRRDLLRAGGFALLGAAAACGKRGGRTPQTSAPTIESIIDGRAQTLAVLIPGALARPNERLPVVLQPAGDTASYLRGGSGRIWLAESRTAPALGPFSLAWHDEDLASSDAPGPKGIYSARVTIPRDGTWLALVEATPRGSSRTLVGGAQLAAGRSSAQPIPGERAISVPTPTPSDHRGVEPYCTRVPACSMHAVSLDRALASKTPIVLIIASPVFCQSATCGPEVDVVQAVSREMGAAATFVHIEVYKDDREAPAREIRSPAAAAWKLDEDPAIYFIDSGGVIADRFIGLAAADEIRQAARALS